MRAGWMEDVERCGPSVDVKDVSVVGTEGEVTGMVPGEELWSGKEEKVVKAKGMGFDSEGMAWADLDSSHWPFLQQEDSRKRNRQVETLNTTAENTCSIHNTCTQYREKKRL